MHQRVNLTDGGERRCQAWGLTLCDPVTSSSRKSQAQPVSKVREAHRSLGHLREPSAEDVYLCLTAHASFFIKRPEDKVDRGQNTLRRR